MSVRARSAFAATLALALVGLVAASALTSETALDDWIERALAYVTTLPPK